MERKEKEIVPCSTTEFVENVTNLFLGSVKPNVKMADINLEPQP